MTTDLEPTRPTDGRPARHRVAGAAASNTPAKLAAHDRRLKALDLRREGHSYREIARQLGWSDHKAASRAVTRALKESVPRAVVDEVREIELDRLDVLWLVMFEQARTGNRLAVDRCLRIMERRAAMLGLDAPVRIQQQIITEDQFEEAIRRLNEEAARLEAGHTIELGPGDFEELEDDD
jgi:Homeodomain-like domain